MKHLILGALLAMLAVPVTAQRTPRPLPPHSLLYVVPAFPVPEPVLDVPAAVGRQEAFFRGRYQAHSVASFHYGDTYDLTYRLPGEALLTVLFHDRQAGFFRLLVPSAVQDPGALVAMLGLDVNALRPVAASEVQKTWAGTVDGVEYAEVVTTRGPSGWQMAEVRVAGTPSAR